MLEKNQVYCVEVTDGLNQLDNNSIDFCMTSPPYWSLRDYGFKEQIGLEEHPQQYIDKLVQVFELLKKKLKNSGSFYLNLGDVYYTKSGGKYLNDNLSNSNKNIEKGIVLGNELREKFNDGKWLQTKQLLFLPCRIAIEMQNKGWILRNNIIWKKSNYLPSSANDRLTQSYEYLFHFVKNKKYYYNLDSIKIKMKQSLFNRMKYKLNNTKSSGYSFGFKQQENCCLSGCYPVIGYFCSCGGLPCPKPPDFQIQGF